MGPCEEYRERVSAMLDDRLSSGEKLELMEHLASCPDCRAYFDDQLAIHEAFADLEAAAPVGFAESVMERVRLTPQERKKPTARSRWQHWAAAAACCAVAVLGVWTMGGPQAEKDAVMDVADYTVAAAEDDSLEIVMDAVASVEESSSAVTTYSAQMEEQKAVGSAQAPQACRLAPEKTPEETVTLTTASAEAARWVEDTLGESWSVGSCYELTEEQMDDLCRALDSAGEAYALDDRAVSPRWYVLLAE